MDPRGEGNVKAVEENESDQSLFEYDQTISFYFSGNVTSNKEY
jgi:hypothetical protein